MALTEQCKSEIIYRLLSEFHFYEIETSGRWTRSLRKAHGLYGLTKPTRLSFYLKNPSHQVLYESQLVYNRTIHQLRFTDYWNKDTIIDFMKRHEVLGEQTREADLDDDLDPEYFWYDNEDAKMDVLSKAIENIKIKLYRNCDAPAKQIEELRKDLHKSQRLYNEVYARKHQFDYLTAEEIASRLYSRHLYGNIFYTKDMQQVKGLPPVFLDNIANLVRQESISGTKIREISHTSPWTQINKTSQPGPFHGITLTSDILQLTSLTRWYEWVRDHPDKPDDKVIDDDDMLDGWYILWERERPKKTDKQIEASKFNVETFVMASTPEEADDIWSRNDPMARGVLKQRAGQLVKDDGIGIKNQDLGDVKKDIVVQFNKDSFAAASAKASGARISTGARKG
jgi:hypothetical protein